MGLSTGARAGLTAFSKSLSVEVDAGDAATVAAAVDVRVVLVEPIDDPAAQQDGGP